MSVLALFAAVSGSLSRAQLVRGLCIARGGMLPCAAAARGPGASGARPSSGPDPARGGSAGGPAPCGHALCAWGFHGSGLRVYKCRPTRVYKCRPTMVSWKAHGEISAIYSQSRSDTCSVMPTTNIFLPVCFVTATPKGPRKPAGGTGETFLRAYHLSLRISWVCFPRGFEACEPPVGSAGCCCLGKRLWRGHLRSPVRKLVPVCVCALLPYGQSKCNIDISVHAEGEWHWSIYSQGWISHTLQYPNGKDTNHRSAARGLLFLPVWHLRALPPEGSPEDIFLPFFFFSPRYPQPPWKGPNLVTFPHPGKKCLCPSDVLAGRLHSICPG